MAFRFSSPKYSKLAILSLYWFGRIWATIPDCATMSHTSY